MSFDEWSRNISTTLREKLSRIIPPVCVSNARVLHVHYRRGVEGDTEGEEDGDSKTSHAPIRAGGDVVGGYASHFTGE